MNPSLIDKLRGRAAPLLIDIDAYGRIVAAGYDFGTPHYYDVTFHHPEGDIIIGLDQPLRAQSLELRSPGFAALSYAAKKATIMEELGCYPWIEYSDEPDEQADTSDHLDRWLAEIVEGDEILNWLPGEMSEHLPGFEILSALDQATQKRLGLREVDRGGPASGGCWAVETEASREELNAALVATDLPFRVVEFGWRYRKTAEQGDATAQRSLGFLYANGQGVAQDYVEAARWFRKAADQGEALAQFGLGTLYANGKGVAQNYAEAARWYRKAADQGHAAAEHNLSLLCAR